MSTSAAPAKGWGADADEKKNAEGKGEKGEKVENAEDGKKNMAAVENLEGGEKDGDGLSSSGDDSADAGGDDGSPDGAGGGRGGGFGGSKRTGWLRMRPARSAQLSILSLRIPSRRWPNSSRMNS